MQVTVTKRFTFEAAHFLTDYDGECSRVHGHSYIFDVTVIGDPEADMIIDFKVLKKIVNDLVIDKLDHQLLNDIFRFKTTAENISKWIFNVLDDAFVGHFCSVKKIQLWETATSSAEVTK